MLDTLGAQLEEPKPDAALIQQCIRNVTHEIADRNVSLPPDVFAPGVNDHIARAALTGLCVIIMSSVSAAARKK